MGCSSIRSPFTLSSRITRQATIALQIAGWSKQVKWFEKHDTDKELKKTSIWIVSEVKTESQPKRTNLRDPLVG